MEPDDPKSKKNNLTPRKEEITDVESVEEVIACASAKKKAALRKRIMISDDEQDENPSCRGQRIQRFFCWLRRQPSIFAAYWRRWPCPCPCTVLVQYDDDDVVASVSSVRVCVDARRGLCTYALEM